jgi:hypothetical protein
MLSPEELLQAPFPENQIGKLPKPTQAQTNQVKQDYRNGHRCQLCGGWHHPDVIHLDYVGHAAVTLRLLSVDKEWSWEPMAVDQYGAPVLSADGVLWIKLTVLGVTRIGCGDAGGKTGGDAMKERIGDAIRNAAMRFGVAIDLWHKGDLREPEDDDETDDDADNQPPAVQGDRDRPEYSQADFDQNFPSWEKAVRLGLKSHQEIIDLVSTRGRLSEKNIKEINSIEIPPTDEGEDQ